MIDMIDKLSENIVNIYDHIGKVELQNPSDQFKEEVLKAELILKYPEDNWEEELLIAERHWYLDGEIKFLLEFSNYKIDSFIKYRDKFIRLFDKNKLDTNTNNEYQTLIHRALLAFEEDRDDLGYLKYTKHGKTDRYTFCVYDKRLRVKNENWRKVFGSDYFKNLLDIIGLNIEIDLKKKIDSYSFNCENFKSYFINPKKDWEIISYIRNYQIEWKNAKEIYLNRGGTAVDKWGWYRVAELYTYYLYTLSFDNKNFLPFKTIWYWDTSEDYPSIMFDDYKNKYILEIYYDNKLYIEFYNEQGNKIKSKNITTILENNGFTLDLDSQKNYSKIIELCEISKISGIVNKLCLDFNN
jgi:hypothetical protein